jgi:hypothetical protein
MAATPEYKFKVLKADTNDKDVIVTAVSQASDYFTDMWRPSSGKWHTHSSTVNYQGIPQHPNLVNAAGEITASGVTISTTNKSAAGGDWGMLGDLLYYVVYDSGTDSHTLHEYDVVTTDARSWKFPDAWDFADWIVIEQEDEAHTLIVDNFDTYPGYKRVWRANLDDITSPVDEETELTWLYDVPFVDGTYLGVDYSLDANYYVNHLTVINDGDIYWTTHTFTYGAYPIGAGEYSRSKMVTYIYNTTQGGTHLKEITGYLYL